MRQSGCRPKSKAVPVPDAARRPRRRRPPSRRPCGCAECRQASTGRVAEYAPRCVPAARRIDRDRRNSRRSQSAHWCAAPLRPRHRFWQSRSAPRTRPDRTARSRSATIIASCTLKRLCPSTMICTSGPTTSRTPPTISHGELPLLRSHDAPGRAKRIELQRLVATIDDDSAPVSWKFSMVRSPVYQPLAYAGRSS